MTLARPNPLPYPDEMARRRWQKGTLYREGRYWKLRWYEDFIDGTGQLKRRKTKPINLGPIRGEVPGNAGLTKAQAERKAAEVMRRVNEDDIRPQSLLTVREFAERHFIPEHVIHCSAAGQKHYHYILDNHVLPILGEMSLRDVSVTHVRQLIGAKSAAYSTETLRKIRNTIHTLFEHAIDADMYADTNPANRRVKIPKKRSSPVQGYTIEEARRILGAMRSPYWEMVVLSMTTSVNVAEMCGITCGRVNLSAVPVEVDGVLIPSGHIAIIDNVYMGVRGDVKADKRRRCVAIAGALRAPLQNLLHERQAGDALFANQAGTAPVNPNNVNRRYFRELGRQLGIHITWHRFRHTHATLTDMLGVSMDDRMAMLGHGTAAMTHRYTHPAERQKAVGEAIVELLIPSGGGGVVQ